MTVHALALATEVVKDENVQQTMGSILLQAAAYVSAALVLLGLIWWFVWPRIEDKLEKVAKQVNETHKSVTVNGGKNSPPTLRDDISELRSTVQQLVTQGGAVAMRTSDLADRLDDIHELVVDTREDFKKHEEAGERYLGKVELVLRDKGIELPPSDR